MTDKKLIDGIFRPQNMEENLRAWQEALPEVNEDTILSHGAEQRVVKIIGKKLKSFLSFMELGDDPIDYYRMYRGDIIDHIIYYANTYRNKEQITTISGFHAWLSTYVRYFALSEHKRQKRNIRINDTFSESFYGIVSEMVTSLEESKEEFRVYLETMSSIGNFKINNGNEREGIRIQKAAELLDDFFIQELSIEEIAKKRNTTNDYIYVAKRRALSEFVMIMLPVIRENNSLSFYKLIDERNDVWNKLFTPNQRKHLILFFMNKMNLDEMAKALDTTSAELRLPLFDTLLLFFEEVKRYHGGSLKGVLKIPKTETNDILDYSYNDFSRLKTEYPDLWNQFNEEEKRWLNMSKGKNMSLKEIAKKLKIDIDELRHPFNGVIKRYNQMINDNLTLKA